MDSAVALIPARSGSRRIPEKNIFLLDGHPLLAYAIQSALQCGLFRKVVVSTDSEKYAAIARHYGGETPFLRPCAMAGERSPDIEWVRHALDALAAGGERFEIFSILRPTSPFRLPQTIRRAYAQFKPEAGVDSLRAVEKCKQHPGKMWVVRGARIEPLLPQENGKASSHSVQYASLESVYVQNASLEIAYTRVVFEDHSIAGRRVMPFFTQGFEGFDINDPEDLWRAQWLIEHKQAVLPEIRIPAYDGVLR